MKKKKYNFRIGLNATSQNLCISFNYYSMMPLPFTPDYIKFEDIDTTKKFATRITHTGRRIKQIENWLSIDDFLFLDGDSISSNGWWAHLDNKSKRVNLDFKSNKRRKLSLMNEDSYGTIK